MMQEKMIAKQSETENEEEVEDPSRTRELGDPAAEPVTWAKLTVRREESKSTLKTLKEYVSPPLHHTEEQNTPPT